MSNTYGNIFGGVTTIDVSGDEARVEAVPQQSAMVRASNETAAIVRTAGAQEGVISIDTSSPRAAATVPFSGQPMQGPVGDADEQLEDDPGAARSAGVSVLLAAGATAAGAFAGGVEGAAAGLLTAGAASNLLRAHSRWGSPDPAERSEARISGAFGLIGMAAGGFLAYRAVQKRGER